MTHFPAVAVLATLAVTPGALLPLLRQEQPGAAAQYEYRGTVQAVQPQAASLSVITGVGFALRLVHIRTMPATYIVSDGAAAVFADIKPGDIVRAKCHMTDAGLVADTLQRIGAMAPAPERRP
jgi:predicted methyltransferase